MHAASRKWDAIVVLVLALFSVAIMAPAIFTIHPNGHSNYLNENWAVEFARALGQGDLYPRWLSGMNDGGGSPAFYFYGPVSFYFASPFLWLGLEPQLALSFATGLILWISGCAAYALLRGYGGPASAAFGAALYVAAPYHFFTDVWIRSAFAALSGVIVITLCVLSLRNLGHGVRWTIALAASYALLIMSHVPSALLASPFFAAIAVHEAWRERNWRHAWRGGVGAALGVGLAAIYLAPALTLQNAIHADMWWSSFFDATRWFLFAGDDSPDPPLMIWLEQALVATTLAFLIAASVLALRGGAAPQLVPWVVVVVGVWFLMTPVSRFVWANVETLSKVQFPYRVASLLDLATCVALTALLSSTALSARAKRLTALAAVAPFAFAMLIGATAFVGGHLVRIEKAGSVDAVFDDHRQWLGSAIIGTAEYLPAWVSFIDHGDFGENFQAVTKPIAEARAVAKVVRASGSEIVFTVDQAEAGPVALPTFYFPAWRGSVGGAPLPTTFVKGSGLVEIELPQGRHDVVLTRVMLPHEKVGLAVSAVALLLCAAYAAAGRRLERIVGFDGPNVGGAPAPQV